MNEINGSEFSLSEYEETIRAVLESGGSFRIYPKGTSMLPLIRQKLDSVSLVSAGELRRGDIVFYKRQDRQFVLHRIIKVQGGEYTMCGDNQLEPEHGITRPQIIAAAEAVYRGEKEISRNNFGYKIYVFLWQSFFLRRIYFRLRRLRNGGKNR